MRERHRVMHKMLAVGGSMAALLAVFATSNAPTQAQGPAPSPQDPHRFGAIFVQCPGDTNGDAIPDAFNMDTNGDTVADAYWEDDDKDGDVDLHDSPAHCMHLAAGDGMVTMADGKQVYTFGFSDVTGKLPAEITTVGTPDAFYNKQYSQFCYTFQYMPGTTTYLDTPVLPTGAFAGPGQATLDAELPVKTPAEKLQAWRNKVLGLVTANPSYLLDCQATQVAGALPPDQTGELLAPILGGEGAAVTVFGRNLPLLGITCPQVARPVPLIDPNGLQAYGLQVERGVLRSKARIDGFSLTGSDQAAGIEVNANACNLEVLNNRIFGTMGDFGSGVKIGHPGALPELADDNAHNDRASVADNHILQNSSLDYSGGGAIAIGTGTWNYTVKKILWRGTSPRARARASPTSGSATSARSRTTPSSLPRCSTRISPTRAAASRSRMPSTLRCTIPPWRTTTAWAWRGPRS